MSATVDQFCDSLRDRLNSVEARLDSAMTNVEVLAEQAEKTVRRKCEEAHRKAQTQLQRVEQLHGSLRIAAQKKVAETKEVISEWKVQGEAQKLNARADRADAYAVDAIEYAGAAIDAAEEAILDAVVSRFDAESLAGCPGALHRSTVAR